MYLTNQNSLYLSTNDHIYRILTAAAYHSGLQLLPSYIWSLVFILLIKMKIKTCLEKFEMQETLFCKVIAIIRGMIHDFWYSFALFEFCELLTQKTNVVWNTVIIFDRLVNGGNQQTFIIISICRVINNRKHFAVNIVKNHEEQESRSRVLFIITLQTEARGWGKVNEQPPSA